MDDFYGEDRGLNTSETDRANHSRTIMFSPAGTTAAVVNRRLSGPALELFNRSNVSPVDVDRALDDLICARASVVLRTGHPILRRIQDATDINIVQVSRRSHYLLISVEQRKDGHPCWQYREHAPRSCTFSCRGALPTTIGVALNGELLEKLVVPALAMSDTVIERVEPSGDGWLNVDVTPPWHAF